MLIVDGFVTVGGCIAGRRLRLFRPTFFLGVIYIVGSCKGVSRLLRWFVD